MLDGPLCMFSIIHKKETDVRISPVQFLRDREFSIRDEKHGIVIKEPVSDWSLLARKRTHVYETNVTRTMSMKRDISGIEIIKDDYYGEKKEENRR